MLRSLNRSMTMPSVEISLPRYVVRKGPRKDGTWRLLFEVPERLRPSGWPATIPLPIDEPRTGDLTDESELLRVIADAKRLYLDLQTARAGRKPSAPPRRDLTALIDAWKRDWPDRELGLRTQRAYEQYANILAAWSQIAPVNGSSVDKITPEQIAQLLRIYKDHPTTARHLRGTLSNILAFGVERAWLSENTVEKVAKRKRSKHKRKQAIGLWTPADVAERVAIAEEAGWIGGAIMIQGLWDSMGRVSDAPLWRRQHLGLADRQLIYDTSKSDGESTAFAVMSSRFMGLVAKQPSMMLVTRMNGKPYRPVADDSQISEDYREIVVSVLEARGGARRLLLRHLRHSSQTHASQCGATAEQIAAGSTHLDPSVTRSRYIQQSLETAAAVARLRGIV